MKYCSKYYTKALIIGITLLTFSTAFAGNPDRAGSAGGTQLLVNPWVRSNGVAGANMADGTPVESMFLNVGGLAFVRKTEVAFTSVNYLSGADVHINTVGIAQRAGETGAIGLTVSSYNFGDIPHTTTATPEGDGTYFNVSLVNIGLSYSKAFSNSIYGGMTLKLLSEGVSDLNAKGVAIDAGIKYVTGERDQVKFGITLKNVGPNLIYRGDGLSFQTEAPTGEYPFTAELRSASYELPSLVSIGISYDFLLAENQNLTAHGTFIANSFTEDNYLIGLEYNFKKLVYIRAGYHYEPGITNSADRSFVYTGFAGGAGLEYEFGEKNTRVSIDYSYRASQPFNGTHCIGARISLGSAE